VTLPGPRAGAYVAWLQHTVVPHIHSTGGLASYNHPYGASGGQGLSAAAQDRLLADVSAKLLANRALGTDILEVGYRGRGGWDLAHHIALWDVVSRNAVFLTANGVSDDHFGTHWATLGNDWITSAWSTDQRSRACSAASSPAGPGQRAGRATGAA